MCHYRPISVIDGENFEAKMVTQTVELAHNGRKVTITVLKESINSGGVAARIPYNADIDNQLKASQGELGSDYIEFKLADYYELYFR